jgi:hypothetical protein
VTRKSILLRRDVPLEFLRFLRRGFLISQRRLEVAKHRLRRRAYLESRWTEVDVLHYLVDQLDRAFGMAKFAIRRGGQQRSEPTDPTPVLVPP